MNRDSSFREALPVHLRGLPQNAGYSVPLSSCSEYLRRDAHITMTDAQSQALTAMFLLPAYGVAGSQWVLTEDVMQLLPILRQQPRLADTLFVPTTLFDDARPSVIGLGPNTELDLGGWTDAVDPARYAAIRNLVSVASAEGLQSSAERESLGYFPPLRLLTSSRRVLEAATRQLEDANVLNVSRASEFANSAYYMGSKKALCSFIVEALRSVLPADGVVLDLMCGSGTVSGACARFWDTVASDAQTFCQVLAEVQGGGFSRAAAAQLLSVLTEPARRHAADLRLMIGRYLDREDELLHGEAGMELVPQYIDFHHSFPVFPAEGTGTWRPRSQVEARRARTGIYPYLLFTAYFANIYVGLRQAVEIDSLRYAIDQLTDPTHRRWALGALIATVSRLATTYGGHFAQPLTANLGRLKHNEIVFLVEQRRYSIFHEFSVRLANLAEESERARYAVTTVPGPWQVAMPLASQVIGQRKAVVYVDPPYTRDEYSRYYHLLETLTSYQYPSVEGVGRTPSKIHAERFGSEFCTRTRSKMTGQLATVLLKVVQQGWTCAWSYADSSAADIKDVLDLVTASARVRVWSFAAPHEHHAQGGKRPRKVTEYLLVVAPST